jgi:PAS domain S-box-containing protein
VELTTWHGNAEIHLLGYGFDPGNTELQRRLAAVRRQNDVSVQGLVGSLRKIGSRRKPDTDTDAGEPPDSRRMETAEAIALIHRAGGRAFLAHPLATHPDPARLDELVAALKNDGLDGIEAVYQPYSAAERAALLGLAEKHGLLVTAGTDFHDPSVPGHDDCVIAMPTALWKSFRTALQRPASGPAGAAPPHPAPPHRPRWRSFVLRIGLPTLLSIGLYVVTIFAVIIPQFEAKLLDRKREMIRELTNSAWSILAEYEVEERAGRMTRDAAQETAKERIQFLRYGQQGKDYFWITDLEPKMVMHPYRLDLNGKDLSDFRDPRGRPIFVEFAELVKKKKEGYVEYVWQWKDDPARIAAKESYIKGFEPWGWIIGTGIYVGDVKEEISRISQTVINVSIAISTLVALLLLFVAQQSMRIERQRFSAQEALREWNERYRSLVEATTEGTAMILGGMCTYANRTLLEMLGYSGEEFGLLEVDDLLPPAEAGKLRLGADDEGTPDSFEADLRRKDGSHVPCILTVNPIDLGGQGGWILIAKDLHRHTEMVDAINPAVRRAGRPVDNVPAGILRVMAARKGNLVEANSAARRMLGIPADSRPGDYRFADFLDSPEEFEEILRATGAGGDTVTRTVFLRRADGCKVIASLAAVAVQGGDDEAARYCDILLEDVTDRKKEEAETRGMMARLETSLLFLHEPVSHFVHEPVTTGMEQPVGKVAALMNRRGATAVLVKSPAGDVVGIVTDRDFRERILAAGLDPATPVFKVMSSPVASVSHSALIYEALLAMEQKNVQHLAVTDESGSVVSILWNKELLQFPRYGSAVLTREIMRAPSVEEVASNRERLPALVAALLECGARSRNVTRVITSVSDAVTQRLVELAVETLGPPPAKFAFVVLGSEGREEQTLVTDQDNAIIYEDLPAGQAPGAARYFQELGNTVCNWLDQAGYRFCPGNFMAKNPAWCSPLRSWKDHFARWITKPEPQELLEFSIFFDLRAVYGARDLVNELRHTIQQLMHDNPPFFPQFARSALQHKPPATGLLAKLVSGGSGEQSRQLNIKDAMVPIVSFARLYALRHGIEDTNTVDRLDTLGARQVLTATSHGEIVLAYDHLMQMRLKHHATAIRDHSAADNTINLKSITHLEQAMLQQTFNHVATIQRKISYDFLGGT